MTARKQKRTCGCRSDARGDRAAVSSPTAASPRLTVSSRTRGQFVSGSTNGTFAESCAYDPLGRRASTTDKVVTVYPGFTGTATTCFAIKDHLGSVQYLVDSTGSIKEQYRYEAWGNVRIMNANSQTISVSAYGNRVLFHGGAYSAATGLYQFRARWYSPELGRWLSPDPIGLEGGLNLYEFCRNDPVNLRDPSGLVVSWAFAGVGALGNLGAYALGSWVGNKPITAGGVTGALVAGAIAGAAAGIFVGDPSAAVVSAIALGALGGAAGGAIGSAIQQGIDTGDVCLNKVKHDALISGLGGALGGGITGRFLPESLWRAASVSTLASGAVNTFDNITSQIQDALNTQASSLRSNPDYWDNLENIGN